MSRPERAGSEHNPSAVWPAVVGLWGDGLLCGLGADDAGHALFPQPVAVALDLDDMAVMEQAVQHRSGEHAVPGEGLIPGAEAEVRGHDGRALLVAGGDDLEEQVGLFSPKWQIADLVNDQQAVANRVLIPALAAL